MIDQLGNGLLLGIITEEETLLEEEVVLAEGTGIPDVTDISEFFEKSCFIMI